MLTQGYLHNKQKETCWGCEACVQACKHAAIQMVADEEGFRYPEIDTQKCIDCGLCHTACPKEHGPIKHNDKIIVFGGHHVSDDVVLGSTSGGAFSAIIEGWCDENYVIFGAETEGLRVFHSYVEDKNAAYRFRKSKYLQSEIGESYKQVKIFLAEGKKVLFSGTPCQIAGLEAFLGKTDRTNLLTIEVVCEGVPSPLLIDKLCQHYGGVTDVDYRYKNDKGRWDFEVMKLTGREHDRIIDRWLNPFWSIWLNHLVSRPSCYECPFATKTRVADISLGDLWGVHLYCPDLYNRNRGASLVICNSKKGKDAFEKAVVYMKGRYLDYEEAVKYQSPLRKPISKNSRRTACLTDLGNDKISYQEIVKKYAIRPSLKLLIHKYIWGNRQKVWMWNLLRKE